MQIVKSDHNSELKKDEETHLRKINSHRSMARKPKCDPQFRAPFRWEGVVGNIMAGKHHGYPDGAQSSEKGQKMRGDFQKRQKCGRERKRGGIGSGRGRGRESRRKKKGIKEVFLQKHLGYKQNFYL